MKLYTFNKKTLQYQKANKYYYIVFSAAALLLLSVSINTTNVIIKKSISEPELMVINNYDCPEFTPERLKKYIKSCGIMHPEIVYAQAKIETGNFNSYIFKEGNNLFGMKLATSRPTTAIGEISGHALYQNWMQSVQDYALYQSAYLRKLKSKDNYLDYLHENYATDKTYVSKIKKIAKL
jgi:uncharacterized FlgJ-related protein